jgi:hypothetical protein
MSTELIISLGAMFLTILSLVYQYFGWIIKFSEKLNTFEKDVIGRLATVETSQRFFQKYVDDIIPAVIHHPNTIDKDKLLENFKNLDTIELSKLKIILLEELPELTARKDPMVMNYIMLLARIDQKIGGDK